MVDLSHAPVMGRFSGENPLDWVLQAEKYFNFYNISSEHKLSWASFYLDGDALEWYHWLFRNKQLAGWDHFVDKLFIRFRRRNREAPGRRLAFLQQFTIMDYYQARATALPSWSNMANLPLHQYCHARSNYDNLNIAHKMSREMPDREIDNVVVTNTKLPAPDAMKPESCAENPSVLIKIDDAAVLVTHVEEEFCNSILDDNKEDAGFPLPQYFVESFKYDNDNNEVHKVFDELSDRSKDAIQESRKEFMMKSETTEEHLSNDSMYLVAPTDAANDCAKVVVNEDKNDEAKIVTIREETLDFVTAIKEKAPLWIGYAFSISSDLIMFDDQHGLELAQCLVAMSCMDSACSSSQLLNRGIFNYLSDFGHAALVLSLHRYPPDQFELDFPFDPGSSLLTTFLRVTKNCVLCGASSNFECDKLVTFNVWNSCTAPLKFQFRNTYSVRQFALFGVAFDDRHCARYFIVCSFDMLSRLAEGIGSGINDLVLQTNVGYLPLCFCWDDAPGIWLYFYGSYVDFSARTLPLQMTKEETEAIVTNTTLVIGCIIHSLKCCVLNLFDEMVETVILFVSNEVFLGNWNGETASLTVENHGLGIQFLKWFDIGHAFMVDSGCTTLPNVPLRSKSDSHTSVDEIAKSRGLVAMSYFETVCDMECMCPYPIFPCSYPETVQQIATFVTVIASNIEGVDYVAGLEGFLLKVKNSKLKAWALEVHSLLKTLSRKVSNYILPLVKIVMYKTCWSSSCYNVDLLVAFNGALRDGIVLLYCGTDTSQADYFNDAISIGSFQALRLRILVVASDCNQGSQSLFTNLALWMFIVAASYTNTDFTPAVEEMFSLYDLIAMWLEGIPDSNLEGKVLIKDGGIVMNQNNRDATSGLLANYIWDPG